MSTRLKKKTALIAAIVAIGLVAMGLTISSVQSKLTIQDYTAEMQQEASQLPDLLAQAQEDTATNTDNYDSFYQSKAASVTYMASHKAGHAATDAKMAQLKELLNVSNVMIVSKQGKIVAKAGDTKADFRKSRFNRLRTTFESGKPSKPVIVDLAEQGWQKRYYSSRIDDDTMVVIEQDPAELTQLVEDSSSTASVLKNISIGQDGYMFAVDARDYLIAYHPDSSLVGTDALQKGLDVAQLEDGAYSWMTLNGVKLYCGVTKIDDMYYIGAVPESSISFARYVSTGVTQFAFLIVMLLVACYGFFVLHDEERRGNTEEDFRAVGSKLRINKVIARKGAILSLVGFVAIVAVAFYMQTLFALSSESVSNKESATQLQQTITRTNERVGALRTQYNTRYLNKCRAAAYIIQSNPSLAEKAP